jgi:hypothetical protein
MLAKYCTLVELCIGAKVWRFSFFFVNVPVHNCHQQCRSTEKHNFFSCFLFVYIFEQQVEILKKGVMYFFMSCYYIYVYREINSHFGTYMYWENIPLVYLGIFCSFFK